MAKTLFPRNRKANEPISKFKLLSAYGGAGSIIHTGFDCSVMVSCIEEWGFIQTIKKIREKAIAVDADEKDYVIKHAREEGIGISNDERLLSELQSLKEMPNLKYLVLIPDVELNENYNTMDAEQALLAINSTYMPKGFFDSSNEYFTYSKWYNKWPEADISNFFPPKQRKVLNGITMDFRLKQDNIVMICENGHISNFPWSKYLRWRIENPYGGKEKVNLFDIQDCCNSPVIQINDTNANASGFDGKWLRCRNKGCQFQSGISLKGLMSVKSRCPGHKPWEDETGPPGQYYGSDKIRVKDSLSESCNVDHMKIALTTANNLYYSRILSSIYMPNELFLEESTLKIKKLEIELENAKKINDFAACIKIADEIESLQDLKTDQSESGTMDKNLYYRHQEYKAFTEKDVEQLNVSKDLVIDDVTGNLDIEIAPYFKRLLRMDNLKITSAQLDFSRVSPNDSDSPGISSKNIFRSLPNTVLSYPVVENYGEGIFFAFDVGLVEKYKPQSIRYINLFKKQRNDFAKGAIKIARGGNWQLYLVHTFCHLIMRELEFRCGYPTASLSERLYISNDEGTKMYGCLIFTAEGAEGSMGGLIAQTAAGNINNLVRSALKRATVCHSDPLCWESEGQGLFELNLASCFSCSLTSETSCEQRNLFLDRNILVDNDNGFFKGLI